MRSLPDSSVDAIVTDPPYCSGSVGESQRTSAKGQGLRSETISRFGWFVGDNMGTAGLVWLLRAMATEALRVVKPTGSVVVFCDWRMVASIQPAIESAGLRFQGLVVWDKGHMGLGRGFRCQHELVLHFTMGSPEYHDLATGNVIKTKRVPALEKEHQTQKPVELMERIIRVVCPPGGSVLDPFMGSGTTGIAAVNCGANFFGCELGAENFEIARHRLAVHQSAPRLFEATPAGLPQQLSLGDDVLSSDGT